MTSDFLQRHKAGFLLSIFIIFSFICLTNRVDPYVTGIKSSVWFLISPEVVYSGRFFNKLDSLRGRLFRLTRAEGENYILRQQNVQLAKAEIERDLLESENSRLRNLLELKSRYFSESIAAEVVGRDIRDWFHSVILNKGETHEVPVAGAVIGGSSEFPALIGRIVEVEEDTSKVLLITDPVSAVSVSIGPSGDLGLLEGRNQPTVLVRYLPNRARIRPGMEVQTVGLGGVFPPGVPVGKVTDVEQTLDGFFKEAVVEPYLDFGSIQEALVLKREQTPGIEIKK